MTVYVDFCIVNDDNRGSDSLTAREVDNLTLIDLLSDRHHLMRDTLDNRWNELHDIQISTSEWYIIGKIYNKNATITQIAKEANLTRQAVHKHVKNLSSKGIVETNELKSNKKGKLICLSRLGIDYYERYEQLKVSLENAIAKSLNEEQLQLLKDLLREDWKIEHAEI